MAAIDKTYIDNVDDMVEVGEWLKTLPKEVIDDYGNKICFKDYICRETYDALIGGKEACATYLSKNGHLGCEGKRFIVLWSTGCVFDLWLIRNCPVSVIRDTLTLQYGEEYVREAIEKKTKYDTFVRPPSPSKRFVTKEKPNFNKSCDCWLIEVWTSDEMWLTYDEDAGYWWFHFEPYIPVGRWVSSAYHMKGKMTRRKIYRLIKKWNLPSGLIITAIGEYVGQKWIFETK